MNGRLAIRAVRRDDGSTAIAELRQEGLARCSRPFYESGVTRLVTLQLGPGFVRGDRFAYEGDVGPGAKLVVAAQAATRVLGAGAPSQSSAVWSVGAGATLHLRFEPLVAYAAAEHHATLDVDLQPGAVFGLLDVIAAVGPLASVTGRVRVRSEGKLLVHDALRVDAASTHGAVGSALYVAAGGADAESARRAGLADAAASVAELRHGVRVGVGSPAAGGVFVRAVGTEPWAVRAALVEILAALAPPG